MRNFVPFRKTCPSKPSPKASRRAWKGCIPIAGSTVTVRIFSGVSAATSSMSIPPAALAMHIGRPVERSMMKLT